MRKMKIVAIASISAMMLSVLSGINPAQADDLTANANWIKATLKIDASKNMVDLYLFNSASSKPVTDAKATTSIVGPGGHKDSKELMGMRMGDAYSYMAMTDMSGKGRYTFDIKVESGKRKANFHFSYDVQ